jgi:hypothetical protein
MPMNNCFQPNQTIYSCRFKAIKNYLRLISNLIFKVKIKVLILLIFTLIIFSCDSKNNEQPYVVEQVDKYHILDETKKKDVKIYEDDVLVKMRRYYISGNIELEYQCNELGHHTGYYVEYFDNGLVKTSGNYKENRVQRYGDKHGVWIEYDMSGKEISREEYMFGEKVK